MNNNIPVNHQGIDEITEDLHELAGLICVGKDEDGLLEWQGTYKEWQEYARLEEEQDYADTDRGRQYLEIK